MASDLASALTLLADQCHLRWAASSKCYLGLYRGCTVEVSHWEGTLYFQFGSPTASIGDQILERFAGFSAFQSAGLPTNWIQGAMFRNASGKDEVSDSTVRLTVDARQLESMGLDRFLRIPDLLAEDLHRFGGSPTPGPCRDCGQPATTLALLHYQYHFVCDACWVAMQIQSPGGRMMSGKPMSVLSAGLLFVGNVLLNGVVSGLIQNFFGGRPGFGWMGWVFALGTFFTALASVYIDYVATASARWPLRVLILAGIPVGLMLGSFWGFHAIASRVVGDIGFADSMRLFWQGDPMVRAKNEISYLFPGALGVGIGAYLFRGEGHIRVD